MLDGALLTVDLLLGLGAEFSTTPFLAEISVVIKLIHADAAEGL